VFWATMKTRLSAGCGLPHEPPLPRSPQMNTNIRKNFI